MAGFKQLPQGNPCGKSSYQGGVLYGKSRAAGGYQPCEKSVAGADYVDFFGEVEAVTLGAAGFILNQGAVFSKGVPV